MVSNEKFAGAFWYNVQTGCATQVCRACVDEPECVAGNYPTLRICYDMGAHCAPLRKKKSSAVPFFGAVAGLWYAPDYLTRER